MKKILSIIFALFLFVSLIQPAYATLPDAQILALAKGRGAEIVIAASNSIARDKQNADYVCTGMSSLSGTLTNGTGTATGSPITLTSGAAITTTRAGTFTVNLASGQAAIATSGTATVTGSPVSLVAGSNTITTIGTGTIYISGMADDVIINKAIQAVESGLNPANGNYYGGAGKVLLLAGQYNIASPLVLNSTGISLCGSNIEATQIQLLGGSNCDMIQVTDTGTSYEYGGDGISDLTIYASSPRYAGNGINLFCGSTGTVNTSGTAVTWASGTVFSTSWNTGKTILINGVKYTISSVTDNYDLVLTTSAGTQTGVAYAYGAPFDCHIANVGESGAYGNGLYSQYTWGLDVTNSWFESNTGNGLDIEGGNNSAQSHFIGVHTGGNTGDGIGINCQGCLVSNFSSNADTGNGIYTLTGDNILSNLDLTSDGIDGLYLAGNYNEAENVWVYLAGDNGVRTNGSYSQLSNVFVYQSSQASSNGNYDYYINGLSQLSNCTAYGNTSIPYTEGGYQVSTNANNSSFTNCTETGEGHNANHGWVFNSSTSGMYLACCRAADGATLNSTTPTCSSCDVAL